MAKKNFTGGIDTLLGGGNATEAKKEVTVAKVKAVAKSRKDDDGSTVTKRKVGRPITNTRTITKSNQEGLSGDWSRVTYILREGTIEKIKGIAYWQRVQLKELVSQIMEQYIDDYEKKNGKVKPIPTTQK